MSAPSGPSDPRDPVRWNSDPSAPGDLAADLRAARRAAPSPAQIEAIAQSVRTAGGPAASELPPAPSAPSAPAAPPPTQAYWLLGAKFWIAVIIPVCAVAFWLGQASRPSEPSSIASEPTASTQDAQPIATTPAPSGSDNTRADGAPSSSSDAGATPSEALSPLSEPDAAAPRARPCVDAEHRSRVSRAQALVAAGDHRGALAELSRDRRQCLSGSMAEDRERLAIEALFRSGDEREARARWGAFRQRFPRSLYARTLSVLLESEQR